MKKVISFAFYSLGLIYNVTNVSAQSVTGKQKDTFDSVHHAYVALQRLNDSLSSNLADSLTKGINSFQHIYDSLPVNGLPRSERKKLINYDKQRAFDLDAALLSSLPYVKDDNPSGFTQTYLEATFRRHYKRRDEITTCGLFRSFFIQGYFSSNVTALSTYDINEVNYVNRLDLYQHANIQVNMHENLFMLHPRFQSFSLWQSAYFIDLMASYMYRCHGLYIKKYI